MSITRTLAFGSLAALAAGVLPVAPVALAADALPRLSEPAAVAPEPGAPSAAEASVTPPPLPNAGQSGAVWYVAIDGEQVGPLTEEALLTRLARSAQGNDTLIWRAGMPEWERVADNQTILAKKVAAALRNPKPKTTPLDEKFGRLI